MLWGTFCTTQLYGGDDVYRAGRQILKWQKIDAIPGYHSLHIVYGGCAKDRDVSVPQVSHALLGAFRGGKGCSDASGLERCALVQLESGKRPESDAPSGALRPTGRTPSAPGQ